MRRKKFYRIFILTGIFALLSFHSERGEILTPQATSTAIRETDRMTAASPVTSHKIDISGLSQAGYPTGCEAVSATVLLHHYNIPIGISEFIDDYLPSEPFYYENGSLHGADPHEAFAGDPYDSSSLGCYAEVIEQSMNQIFHAYKKNLTAHAYSGLTLREIEQDYLSLDIPVAVWVTIDMKESRKGTTYLFDNGEEFTWISGEHCMVLMGFDEKNYYLLDPLQDGCMVCYEKELVEKRYEELGSQALVIKESNR